jgi:ATP-dependent Clp protease ATP-binding subunit ClpC
MLPIDRFTESAQDIPVRAVDIMQRYEHNHMDSEHVLLALLEQPEGAIPQIFKKLGVDHGQIQKRLDDVLRTAPPAAAPAVGPGQVSITPRVFHLLELADKESQHPEAKLISPEHFLLALLSEQDTAVASILSEAGITIERVQQILQKP